jgi:hypothetical protein
MESENYIMRYRFIKMNKAIILCREMSELGIQVPISKGADID